jgi:hypothetical protein
MEMTAELLRLINARMYNDTVLVHRAYHASRINVTSCHQCGDARALLTEIDRELKEMTK